MIDKALEAKILRYHFVEQWGVNTIARQLGIHHTTVDRVLSQAGLPKAERTRRSSIVDPYHPMIIDTLAQFPTLSAALLTDDDGKHGSDFGARRRYHSSLHAQRRRPEAGRPFAGECAQIRC